MNQLSIYHELGMKSDPIFDEIELLESEQQTIIHDVAICRNGYGLFELKHPDFHECAGSVKDCYNKLMKFLNEKLLEE